MHRARRPPAVRGLGARGTRPPGRALPQSVSPLPRNGQPCGARPRIVTRAAARGGAGTKGARRRRRGPGRRLGAGAESGRGGRAGRGHRARFRRPRRARRGPWAARPAGAGAAQPGSCRNWSSGRRLESPSAAAAAAPGPSRSRRRRGRRAARHGHQGEGRAAQARPGGGRGRRGGRGAAPSLGPAGRRSPAGRGRCGAGSGRTRGAVCEVRAGARGCGPDGGDEPAAPERRADPRTIRLHPERCPLPAAPRGRLRRPGASPPSPRGGDPSPAGRFGGRAPRPRGPGVFPAGRRAGSPGREAAGGTALSSSSLFLVFFPFVLLAFRFERCFQHESTPGREINPFA